MAKSDVTFLATSIGGDCVDSVQISNYYDDVINDLSNRGFFTETRLIPRNADGVTYTKPTDLNRILAVSYDDNMLSRTDLRNLATFGQDWRDHKGPQPYLFTTTNESSDTFRIYPQPSEAAKAFSFPTGTPEGQDFPSYAVSVVATVRREDVQPWLDLPIALLVVSKEFWRESDHTDQRFAQLCAELGELILKVI